MTGADVPAAARAPGAPVIITPAAAAAFDAAVQAQRHARAADQLLTGRWWREARERTFGPLDAWLRHGRST